MGETKTGLNAELYNSLRKFARDNNGVRFFELRKALVNHKELGPLLAERPEKFGILTDDEVYELGYGHVALFEIMYERLGDSYYLKLSPTSSVPFGWLLEGIVRKP